MDFQPYVCCSLSWMNREGANLDASVVLLLGCWVLPVEHVTDKHRWTCIQNVYSEASRQLHIVYTNRFVRNVSGIKPLLDLHLQRIRTVKVGRWYFKRHGVNLVIKLSVTTWA